MTKHTPGPWEAWNVRAGRTMRNWRVGAQNHTAGVVTPVAVISGDTDYVPGDQQVANAFLIAAAPDLLKALKGVQHHNKGTKDAYKLPQSIMREVDAAVAKAEQPQ